MRFTALFALASISCFALAAPQDVSSSAKDIKAVSMAMMPGMMRQAKPIAILLKKDGTAVYIVQRGKMKGTYRTSGLTADFEKVAKALEDCNYKRLLERFGPHGMSNPMMSISVKSVVGSTKTFSDAGLPHKNEFGRKAPAGVKQVEQTLMLLMNTASWQKVSDKTDIAAIVHPTE